MAFELNRVVDLDQLLILLYGFVVANITDRQKIPDLGIGAYSVMELCIRCCQVRIW